jgi:hypothetical protein
MEFTILPCSLPSWIQEWPFENSNCWAPILIPVILVTQQAELRKTEVQIITRPILWQTISKILNTKKGLSKWLKW